MNDDQPLTKSHSSFERIEESSAFSISHIDLEIFHCAFSGITL